MKRVAFIQIYIRHDKAVLKTTYAAAEDVAFFVGKTAVNGVGVEHVARLDGMLYYRLSPVNGNEVLVRRPSSRR